MDKIDWNELFEEETSELKNHMKKREFLIFQYFVDSSLLHDYFVLAIAWRVCDA